MKPLTPAEREFFDRYAATLPSAPHVPQICASVAGDQRNANQLLQLYLEGKKTAASGLLKDYLTVGDPLPVVGKFWIILDSENNPRCIVRTTAVESYTFDEIPEGVAKAEGEGDLSLEYWRKTHIDFFTPYLKEWGVTDLHSEKVIVEYFDVVFKA